MSISPWIKAARLRTLPLALAGTVSGNLLAYLNNNSGDNISFILCVLTAVFLQILSNYANDYGDFKNGADTDERTDRMLASGKITISAMRFMIVILIVICLSLGVSLLVYSIDTFNTSFFVLLSLGIAGIMAAYFYTAGKKPYGYNGFGDLSVFLFFGLLSVLGSYYLQTQTLDLDALFLSLSIGFLSVGVLNINNIRDIETDRQKNKWTIPAKIGKSKALIYHLVLLCLAFVFILSSVASQLNLLLFIYFVAFSLFILIHYSQLSNCKTRNDYNAQLKKLSLGTFVFSIPLIIIQFFF